MMRGKRKGRGGRKGPQNGDLPTDSPKRKDSRLEFQGPCLSHASPPITNFFPPQSKEASSVGKGEDLVVKNGSDTLSASSKESDIPEASDEQAGSACKNEAADSKFSDIVENSSECNIERELGHIEEPQSQVTPHKIIIPEALPPLLSPSSALSQLSIANGALKKAPKSRRKLNPNQTSNQLTPTPTASKLNCCTKTKASSVNGSKSATAATSTNGSQSQLTDYFPVRRSVRKTKKTVLEERQRTLEEAVATCKEEGLEIHNFEGKGRGIVAVRPFVKGEFVVEYAGELIKMDEAREREKLYAQDQNTGCYMYYFKYRNQQYCVDATPESKRLGRLVNHSRNGNLLTKTIIVDNNPRLVLIAKEDIQPGDEVTYDYGDRSKESLKYHPWLAS